MNATGPQEEANVGPTTLVISQMLRGITSAMISTVTPTASIIQRLNASIFSSLIERVFGRMSWLRLKPTSDRKVVAEESAAAIRPASNSAPSQVGRMLVAAQIIVLSMGSMSDLVRFTVAAVA